MKRPHPSTRSRRARNFRASLLPIFVLLLAAPSCSKNHKAGDDWPGSGSSDYSDGSPFPSRDESHSFYGPGSGDVDKSQFGKIRFAFDSYTLSGDGYSKTTRVADHLAANASNLLIAGFTDTAGTEEYNRVLGERRALSVREALLGMGVAPSRIQTVSFGEDMPDEPGNDAANRRVEFGIVE